MLIASKMLPDIRKAIESGRPVPEAFQKKCTASLPALLYLGLLSQQVESHGRQWLNGLGVAKLPALCGLLERTGRQRAENDFGTYPYEAFRIGNRDDLLGEDWIHFCDRFRRAASRRKQSPAALALTSVFREMADNIPSHAYADPKSPCRALAGYHVTTTGTCFSVVDDGQGFLQSLRRNPAWASLASEHDALHAVVDGHATARVGEKEGNGFKQLFNGLLNLNGLVFLRSGGSSFVLKNIGNTWEREERDSYLIQGSQVTFNMSTTGQNNEGEV